MQTSRPQVAFLAAALVLLVLPLLVMLGLSALGMAMHLGMTSQIVLSQSIVEARHQVLMASIP